MPPPPPPARRVIRPSVPSLPTPASARAKPMASTATSSALRPGNSPCSVEPTPTIAATPRTDIQVLTRLSRCALPAFTWSATRAGDHHGQAGELIDEQAPAARGGTVQLESQAAPMDLIEKDSELQPRQRLAEASVRTGAERKMLPSIATARHEFVRMLVEVRIAVRRCVEEAHRVALANGGPPEVD